MDITLVIEEEGSGRSEEAAVTVDEDAVIADALAAADINPETVLVERDDRIVPTDAAVGDAEELRVLDVISGG